MKYLALLLTLGAAGASAFTETVPKPAWGPEPLVRIQMSNQVPVQSWSTDKFCSGLYYQLDLDDDKDYLIWGGAFPDVIRYPIQIHGGRNVHILGLHIELDVQEGCDVGDLPNFPVAEWPNSNIHPRPPTSRALLFRQTHTTYIEGVFVDLKGHQADCFVSRNPDNMTDEVALAQRQVVIVNSRCQGIEGHGHVDGFGDGTHGDFFQNQGGDILASLIVENVSVRSSYEGLTTHGSGGANDQLIQSIVLRRFDYAGDYRYIGDDALDYKFGLTGEFWSYNAHFEDVCITDPNGNDYFKWNNQRYGIGGSSVETHNGVSNCSTEYAPESEVGLNYPASVFPNWVADLIEELRIADITAIAVENAFLRHRGSEIYLKRFLNGLLYRQIEDLKDQLAQCN